MKHNKNPNNLKSINLELKDGILFTKYISCKIDVSLAKEIVAHRINYTEGHIYPALITSSGIVEITKEARNFFGSQKGSKGLSAIALVYESSKLNQIIMNFMLKLHPPLIPIKSFKNSKKALHWLTKLKKD